MDTVYAIARVHKKSRMALRDRSTPTVLASSTVAALYPVDVPRGVRVLRTLLVSRAPNDDVV